MVDKADQDNRNKTEEPLAAPDSDWGKDWEAAFQSEEAMLPSDEAGGNVEEFFLDDADKAGAADQAIQQSDSDQTVISPADFAAAESAPPSPAPTFGQILATRFFGLFKWFAALTLKQKLIAGVSIVGVLALLLVGYLVLTPAHQPLVTTAESPVPPPIPEVVVGPQAEDAALFPKTDSHGEPLVTATKIPDSEPPPPTEAHLVRHKWVFPDFFIPTAIVNPTRGGVTFARLKLTLIASLPPGETLPEDKRIVVREMIYRFYRNQPPEELQRFVQARSDMASLLLTWLKEQWPGNPVKYIQIDSYSLS